MLIHDIMCREEAQGKRAKKNKRCVGSGEYKTDSRQIVFFLCFFFHLEMNEKKSVRIKGQAALIHFIPTKSAL